MKVGGEISFIFFVGLETLMFYFIYLCPKADRYLEVKSSIRIHALLKR